MKRVISLLLCLVMACTMLVSCGETVIGEHLDELINKFYEEPEKKISLKLYVISDAIDDGARQEVKRRINALAESKYNTKLDVVYLDKDNYDAAVKTAVQNGEDAIVLIHSEALMMELYGDGTDANPVTVPKTDTEPEKSYVTVGAFEELTDLLAGNTYGLLNAKIAASLIEASKLDYSYQKGEETVSGKGIFSIPNNHLIDGTDGYTYLQIDREACEIWLNYTKDYLEHIGEQAYDVEVGEQTVHYIGMNDLKAELSALGLNPDDYVKVIKGNYATKAEKEADETLILNVLSAPETTAEDAFSGAFAVLKGTDRERAMRIIYAINMDSDLHNLLQYGIKDTNYQLNKVKVVVDGKETEVEVVTRITTEGKNYDMNIRYTGNAFSAHFCEDEEWTAVIKAYAEAQNKAADLAYAAKHTAE